jgi:hypothetical protein
MKKLNGVVSRVHGKVLAIGGLVASSLAAGAAFAADVDVTSVTATITSAATAAATIGLAVLSLHYGIKLYKWVKGAG